MLLVSCFTNPEFVSAGCFFVFHYERCWGVNQVDNMDAPQIYVSNSRVPPFVGPFLLFVGPIRFGMLLS